MNLFGYETDGVPAPGDFELAELDRANRNRDGKIGFNDACTELGITHEREQFHQWLHGAGPFTLEQWRAVLEIFTLQNDDDDMVALTDRQGAAEYARHDRDAEHADLY